MNNFFDNLLKIRNDAKNNLLSKRRAEIIDVINDIASGNRIFENGSIFIMTKYDEIISMDEGIEYFKDIIDCFRNCITIDRPSRYIYFQPKGIHLELKSKCDKTNKKIISSFIKDFYISNHIYLFWILKHYFVIDVIKIILENYLWEYKYIIGENICFKQNKDILTYNFLK
jgi:hypothetical protein